MARLQDVLEAMMTGAVAQQAGRFQATQIRQQREQQEFEQRARAAEGLATQQGGLREALARLAPQLDPDSQGLAFGGMFNQPDPRAGLVNDPYVQRRPALARIYQGYQQPAAPAGQAPLQPRQFRVPGIAQPLSVKGVTKEQIAQRQKSIQENRRLLQKSFTAYSDPNAKAEITGILQELDTHDVTTPEGYQNLGGALNRAAKYTAGGDLALDQFAEKQLQSDTAGYEQEFEKGGKDLNDLAFAGALPGWLERETSLRTRAGKRGYGGKGLQTWQPSIDKIKGLLAEGKNAEAEAEGALVRRAMFTRKSPEQLSKSIGAFYKALSLLAPTQRTPEVIAKLAKNTGADVLTEGFDDGTLLLGGAAAEKAYQDFLKRMSTQNFAGLSRGAQAAMINEARTLAQYLGRRVDLPTEIVAKLTPWQKAQLAKWSKEFGFKGRMVDVAEGNLEVSRARLNLDRDKARLDKMAKAGELTEQQQAAITAKRGAVEQARELLRIGMERLAVIPANVDIDNPKDDKERQYADLINTLRAAEDDYVAHMRTLGIDLEPVADSGYRPTPEEPAPPEMERSSFLGIPYGPERPVPGTGGTPKAGAVKPSAAGATQQRGPAKGRLQQAEISRLRAQAQTMKREGKRPGTQAQIDMVRHLGGNFEAAVKSAKPENARKMWLIHWYLSAGGK
jgi:hypothetical protein